MNGPQIKQARQRLGLNVATMARALGVHRDTYSKWERSAQRAPAVAVRLIATLLWLQSIGWFENFLTKFATRPDCRKGGE